jgi:hypothetical protein
MSQFEKMGESPLVGSVVNISGNRSPYTTAVARKGPSSDGESEPNAHRGQAMATGEHSGPCFRPQTTLFWPNTPDQAATGRNVRLLPSASSKTGNGDFWNDRASQSGQVIA